MICCGSDLVGRMEGGLWAAFVWGVAEFGLFLFCFGAVSYTHLRAHETTE